MSKPHPLPFQAKKDYKQENKQSETETSACFLLPLEKNKTQEIVKQNVTKWLEIEESKPKTKRKTEEMEKKKQTNGEKTEKQKVRTKKRRGKSSSKSCVGFAKI